MLNTENLHWSFNHTRENQRDFGKSILQALSSYLQGRAGEAAVKQPSSELVLSYDVLPNFWRGYRRSSEQTEKGGLSIGRFELGRTLDKEGRWQYSIYSENSTSGEHLRAEFRCGNDTARTLVDSWHIETENTAGNLHKQFACTGQICSPDDDTQEIRLSVNGLEFVSGHYGGDLPITCTWAMYDVIPLYHNAAAAVSDGIDLAIVDDLEKLKSPIHLAFLEYIDFGVSDEIIQLAGYCVYGNGMVPSYWWVDSLGNVVIASTIFQTMVLRKAGHQAGAK